MFHKYLAVFLASWQGEFVYRLNFILWRFRNILRFLMTYFLWKGIFVSNQNVFGYSQEQMLMYVFMVLAIQALVLSAPSADNIGSEIASGDLSNYLVKPIGYLKFWFTRDLASKLLNIMFATGEITLLWLLFKPKIELPGSIEAIVGFLIISVIAVGIYYFLNVITRFVAFWTPENTWPLAFLVLILIELFGGGIFPLDILPAWVSGLLQFTPYPYLIYFPISIFLGKITGLYLLKILIQSVIWLVIMYFIAKKVWQLGIKDYAASGK